MYIKISLFLIPCQPAVTSTSWRARKTARLYVGVTTNLLRRTFEHRESLVEGFTQKYQVHFLVYYEIFEIVTDAIKREKQLKRWKREWKMNLIEKQNPGWRDLYEDIAG